MDHKKHNVVAKDIKTGDLMALIYWVTVDSKNLDGTELMVRDLDSGTSFKVFGKDLVERSLSADQYHEVVKATKTQMAEILVESHNRPITVYFTKSDGTDRKMRCRLIKQEPLMGRSMVEELDTTDKNRLRQVDHRTIQYLIVDGVKYEEK